MGSSLYPDQPAFICTAYLYLYNVSISVIYVQTQLIVNKDEFTIYSLTAIIIDFFVQSSAVNLVSALWQLMEGGLEELRILQTIILLITTSNIVHGECLGKVSHFFTFPLRLMIQFYAGMVFIMFYRTVYN